MPSPLCPPPLPSRSTRWGHYLPVYLCLLRSLCTYVQVCVHTHARACAGEDWLCQGNTIFNHLLKVRFRYHHCQQHSFVSQQRNSLHIHLGFCRRQTLGLSDFNKPIHVEGCFLGSSLKSTCFSTISYPPTAKDLAWLSL